MKLDSRHIIAVLAASAALTQRADEHTSKIQTYCIPAGVAFRTDFSDQQALRVTTGNAWKLYNLFAEIEANACCIDVMQDAFAKDGETATTEQIAYKLSGIVAQRVMVLTSPQERLVTSYLSALAITFHNMPAFEGKLRELVAKHHVTIGLSHEDIYDTCLRGGEAGFEMFRKLEALEPADDMLSDMLARLGSAESVEDDIGAATFVGIDLGADKAIIVDAGRPPVGPLAGRAHEDAALN